MTEREPCCTMLCNLMCFGMERLYQTVQDVETKSGKLIDVTIDPDSLWWTIEQGAPHIHVKCGGKRAKISLMDSYGHMAKALTDLTA